MEIILLEKIRNLGQLGDKVKVSPGYARNFLIPQKKAVRADAKSTALFEERRAELEAKAKESLDGANLRAADLANIQVTITAKASEEGKLYGSIGTREIAEAISAKGAPVEKSEVILPSGTLRDIGEFEVDVLLHSDVTVTVTIVIEAD